MALWEPESDDPSDAMSKSMDVGQALDQLDACSGPADERTLSRKTDELAAFERSVPSQGVIEPALSESGLSEAGEASEDEADESSLHTRAACMLFGTALLAVIAVVAVFIASERSALRRADADTFGALGDLAAHAIIRHADAARGDLNGPAFEAIQSEVALLAESKGIRQVALFFGDSEEVLSARPTGAEDAQSRFMPLPTISGPGRVLRSDHLVVARAFRLRSSDQSDAMLVVEAGYPGLQRRMRDLMALSGRIVGLAAVCLIFLVPLLSRWLLGGLVRAAATARAGDPLAPDDVRGSGAEVVDLVQRLEADQALVVSLQRSNLEIVDSARQHIHSLRDQRTVSDRAADSARAEARAATAAKAAFVANTSHEVRTPLHAVLGTNALLLETDLDAEQKALAERSMRASKTLLSLVEDVLDLARFDSRELQLQRSSFDPGTLLEEVAELAAPLAATKGLEITCYVSPAVPTRLVGDPARVRQALMRLVDNAIKFTEVGEIGMDLAWEMDTDGSPRAIFTVSDTGLGIGDEERARLFHAFEQLDKSNTRRHGGVGLGLALVARIARAAGGEVRLESRRGHGSTFRLALPLAVDPEEARRITRGERPVLAPLAGVTVLVLDDSPQGAKALGRTLTDLGATAVVETSTYAGFENILRSDIDVVLLDSLLAGRDAFLGALESNEQSEPKPVVLMAPAHVLNLPTESRDEAVTAMMPKPLTRDSIVKVIRRVLDEFQGAAEPVDPEALAKSAEEAAQQELIESKIRSRVRILLVEDNYTNQQLVQYILGKRGYKVEVASNGRLAVDACTVADYDVILMDCQMPEMDGYEATSRIRGLETARGRRTPILAMTASILDSDRERCLTAGMDDMITKPFQPHKMLAWLETWLLRSAYDVKGEGPAKPRVTRSQVKEELERREVARGAHEPSERPAGSPADLPAGPPVLASAEEPAEPRAGEPTRGPNTADVREDDALEQESAIDGALDHDVLGVLLEDEEGRVLASELINGFLEIAPDRLKEMEAAVAMGNLDLCASIAHGLVSTSGTVGAVRLALLLREVERSARGGDGTTSARIVESCAAEVDLAKRALLRAVG